MNSFAADMVVDQPVCYWHDLCSISLLIISKVFSLQRKAFCRYNILAGRDLVSDIVVIMLENYLALNCCIEEDKLIPCPVVNRGAVSLRG